MDSMNVSTTLSPEQQICLDRLLAEGGIRKKRKLPLPLKVKGELKKDGKDESTTTISERLWEDEWHRDSGQCQQAVEAASSSKGDGQQPHEETEGMSKQLDKWHASDRENPSGYKDYAEGSAYAGLWYIEQQLLLQQFERAVLWRTCAGRFKPAMEKSTVVSESTQSARSPIEIGEG